MLNNCALGNCALDYATAIARCAARVYDIRAMPRDKQSPRHFTHIGDWLSAILPPNSDRPANDDAQRRLADCLRTPLGEAAPHCRALLFASGRVALLVDSAVWAQAIRHRSTRLLQAIIDGGIDAREIVVKVRPRNANEARAQRDERGAK